MNNFKSGLIIIEYIISNKTKIQIIEISENDTIHFINNRQMKKIPR
jgi:hypothetical protein